MRASGNAQRLTRLPSPPAQSNNAALAAKLGFDAQELAADMREPSK